MFKIRSGARLKPVFVGLETRLKFVKFGFRFNNLWQVFKVLNYPIVYFHRPKPNLLVNISDLKRQLNFLVGLFISV